jgi:hypothetical protein
VHRRSRAALEAHCLHSYGLTGFPWGGQAACVSVSQLLASALGVGLRGSTARVESEEVNNLGVMKGQAISKPISHLKTKFLVHASFVRV